MQNGRATSTLGTWNYPPKVTSRLVPVVVMEMKRERFIQATFEPIRLTESAFALLWQAKSCIGANLLPKSRPPCHLLLLPPHPH